MCFPKGGRSFGPVACVATGGKVETLLKTVGASEASVSLKKMVVLVCSFLEASMTWGLFLDGGSIKGLASQFTKRQKMESLKPIIS